MKEYGREANARLRQRFHDAARDRPRSRWHLRTPRDAGEHRPVHRHGPRVRVPVVDRSTDLRDKRFERPVREGEPQAGKPRGLGGGAPRGWTALLPPPPPPPEGGPPFRAPPRLRHPQGRPGPPAPG